MLNRLGQCLDSCQLSVCRFCDTVDLRLYIGVQHLVIQRKGPCLLRDFESFTVGLRFIVGPQNLPYIFIFVHMISHTFVSSWAATLSKRSFHLSLDLLGDCREESFWSPFGRVPFFSWSTTSCRV